MKARTTTTREGWIAAGIALLREGGEDELTIDRLARRLRRTKGSFYHHFVDIDAFRAALLEAWTTTHTLVPIEHAESESVRDRRARLYDAVGKLDHRLELAVRGWATRSELARAAREAVDERRVAYLTGLWSGKRRKELAEIEYATFLGLLHRHGVDYVHNVKPMKTLLRALEKLADEG